MPKNLKLFLLNSSFGISAFILKVFNGHLSKNVFKRRVALLLSKLIRHPKTRIGGFDFEYKLDTTLGYQLFFLNSFEKFQMEYCRKFITENGHVIDIGANIGIYSFLYAQIAHVGLVVAIEPGRESFRLLMKNTMLFKNIIPLNVALSDETQIVKFYDSSDSAYSGLKDTGRSQILGTRDVLCYRADDLIGLLKFPKIDFIKIDVEGFELNVINGLGRIIDNYRPVILCEISTLNSPKDPEVAIKKMIDFGYEAFVFREDHVVPYESIDHAYQDYLFIPLKSKRKDGQ